MSNIKWGIIGCGNVTEVKSGPAFNLVENSELLAVMRRDAEKAADYAERHHVPKWYSNADVLMDDSEINAIYIATPPVYHKDLAIKAMRKGHHVYVEKPITLNASEAMEMTNVAEASRIKLCAAHYRRGLPMFNFIKQSLGKVGNVQLVDLKMWKAPVPSDVENVSNWRLDPKQSGGGYFHDLAPHQLDLMIWFFGLPLRHQGVSFNQMKKYLADDVVSGTIIFKDEVIFTGSWNFAVSEHDALDQCSIIGSKGSIHFPVFGNKVLLKTGEGVQEFRFEHPKHIQQPMIDAVVKFFSGSGETPCPMKEACAVMGIMDSFALHMERDGTTKFS